MKLLTAILLLSTSANAIPYVDPHDPSPATLLCESTLNQAKDYCSVNSKNYNMKVCELFDGVLEERGCGGLPESFTMKPSTAVAASSPTIKASSLVIATTSPSQATTANPVNTGPTVSPTSTPSPTIAGAPSAVSTAGPVQTGPGVCAVYKKKIAAIVLPATPTAKSPPDYFFDYEVLRVNQCYPLPSPAPCCGLINPQGSEYDSAACAIARRLIYEAVPFSKQYQLSYAYLVQERCKDLPPASASSPPAPPPPPPPVAPAPPPVAPDPKKKACDALSDRLRSIGNRKSDTYRAVYDSFRSSGCQGYPAPPA